MNAAINIHAADPLEELDRARTRRDAALQTDAAAKAEAERKATLEFEYRRSAENAARAVANNEDVEVAEGLVNQQRVAEARHRAAQNMARKSTAERDAAAADLQAAERAVQSAARAVVIAETREVTQPRYYSNLDAAAADRELMLAVYTVIPESLTPQEALALDQPMQRLQTFTSLGMRSPEWDVPICAPLVREGAAEQALKVARARIDTQREALIARLHELTHGTDR